MTVHSKELLTCGWKYSELTGRLPCPGWVLERGDRAVRNHLQSRGHGCVGSKIHDFFIEFLALQGLMLGLSLAYVPNPVI